MMEYTLLLTILTFLAIVAIVQCWPAEGKITIRHMHIKHKMSIGCTVMFHTKIPHPWEDQCFALSAGDHHAKWNQDARVFQAYFAKESVTFANFKPPNEDSPPDVRNFTNTDPSFFNYTKLDTITVHIMITDDTFIVFVNEIYFAHHFWNKNDTTWNNFENTFPVVTGTPITSTASVSPALPRHVTVKIDPESTHWRADSDKVFKLTGWFDNNNERVNLDFFGPYRSTDPGDGISLMTVVFDFNTNQVACNHHLFNGTWEREMALKPNNLRRENFWTMYFYNTQNSVLLLVNPNPGPAQIFKLVHRKDSKQEYVRFKWSRIYVAEYGLVEDYKTIDLMKKAAEEKRTTNCFRKKLVAPSIHKNDEVTEYTKTTEATKESNE